MASPPVILSRTGPRISARPDTTAPFLIPKYLIQAQGLHLAYRLQIFGIDLLLRSHHAIGIRLTRHLLLLELLHILHRQRIESRIFIPALIIIDPLLFGLQLSKDNPVLRNPLPLNILLPTHLRPVKLLYPHP